MDILNQSAASGAVISHKMFGAPFSRFHTSGDPGRYAAPLDAVSAQSIRVWYDPLTGAFSNSTEEISVKDALSFAADSGIPVVLCIETKGLLKEDQDNNIFTPRQIDHQQVHKIEEFVKALLAVEGTHGWALPDAMIDAIEIGNEYWGGDGMTSVEYGKIANILSIAIQGAIDELGSSAIWDPNILVQMGSGYAPEFNSTQALSPYYGYTWSEAVERANLDIISRLSEEAKFNAIDGMVEHYYYLRDSNAFFFESYSLGQIDRDIEIWQSSGFDDKLIYITEWNNKQSNPGQFGLKGAGVMVEMFENMIRMGVDAATVWPFQHNHTRLVDTLSLDASGNPRMTPRGAVFKLMAENLPGTRRIDSNLTTAEGYKYELNAYASDESFVFYISSRAAARQTISLDLSHVVQDMSSVVATHVTYDPTTADGRYFTGTTLHQVPKYQDPDALAIVSTLANVGDAGSVNFQLRAYEIVQLVFSLPPGDSILGTSRADTLDGGDGRDTIVGASGSDIICSGSGSDSVDGSSGRDKIFSSHGNDTVAGGSGSDYVRGGLGDDKLSGGSGNDTIFAGVGDDKIDGGGGADLIYGQGGADVVKGLSGDDTIVGGFDNDTIDGGEGADRLLGDKGTDSINGGVGDDTIMGGTGDDTIVGGEGKDLLVGGDGRDSFVFDVAVNSSNVDSISDFTSWYDIIVLDNSVFTELRSITLPESAFSINRFGKAMDANDRIIYEAETGKLFYDPDGNTGVAAIHFATLGSGLSLSSSNFMIY